MCSVTASWRRLHQVLGRNQVPAVSTIERLLVAFEETGSVANHLKPSIRGARSEENTAATRKDTAEMRDTCHTPLTRIRPMPVIFAHNTV